MGLDLILYKKTKDIEEMSMEEELDSELAYGRKTWALARFFMNMAEENVDDEYYFPITEEDWNTFIDSFEPFFKSEDICNLIREYSPEEDTSEKIYDLIEHIMNTGFGKYETYTLGAVWEAQTTLEWYEADREVRDAFEEGEVWLIVSY